MRFLILVFSVWFSGCISGWISNSHAASRRNATVTESVEIPLGFSVLRNSETCRASRTLSKSTLTGAQICFSSQAWNAWLSLASDQWDLSRLQLTGKWEFRVFDHGEQRVFKVYALTVTRSSIGFLQKIQQSVIQGIELKRWQLSETYAQSDYLGVFRRLILDERPSSELTEQHELMRELGFVHLLTPSGLHLYALARWIFFFTNALVFFLGFRFTRAHRFAQGITLSVVTWSWALTGFRWGLLRPLLMIAVSEAAKRLGFKFRKGSSLLLAILVDCLFEWMLTWNGEPATFAMGRMHYILAVGGGLLAIEESDRTATRRTFASEFQQHVKLAFGSWITTAIYDGFLHSSVSLATPFLSLITVPVLGSWVYPLLIAGSLPNRVLSEALEAVSNGIFQNSFYFWVPAWALAAGACMGLLFLLNKKSALVFLIGTLMLRQAAATFENLPSPFAAAQSVEQLNIGQGDAALVTVGKENLRYGLVDTGSVRAKSLVAWLRLFSERGILSLDFVALTHLDEDHSGALTKIADLIPVKCVVTSERQWENPRGVKFARGLREKSVPSVNWKSGCFPFSYSAPEDREPAPVQTSRKHPRANGNMSAVWIPVRTEKSAYDYVALGDAHVPDEWILLPWMLRQKTHVPIVFKVSHHGSNTSTSEKMLRELKPAEAWISFGAGNRYGHPTMQTLEKLKNLGISVKTTVLKSIKK